MIENILGVKGVRINITIKQNGEPNQIKQKITKAFERLADIEAKNISIKVDGNTVKLIGRVNSFMEKEEANRIAYKAPGVYRVENELEVIGIHKNKNISEFID